MTDNYTLMCREAKEIQERWKDKSYDRVCYLKDGKPGNPFTLNHPDGLSPRLRELEYSREDFVWLPRIEDLIEMYPNRGTILNDYEIIWLLQGYSENDSTEGKLKFSLQEWMLKFFMHTAYSKTWTGSEWVAV